MLLIGRRQNNKALQRTEGWSKNTLRPFINWTVYHSSISSDFYRWIKFKLPTSCLTLFPCTGLQKRIILVNFHGKVRYVTLQFAVRITPVRTTKKVLDKTTTFLENMRVRGWRVSTHRDGEQFISLGITVLSMVLFNIRMFCTQCIQTLKMQRIKISYCVIKIAELAINGLAINDPLFLSNESTAKETPTDRNMYTMQKWMMFSPPFFCLIYSSFFKTTFLFLLTNYRTLPYVTF